jgi:hypothetical protein
LGKRGREPNEIQKTGNKRDMDVHIYNAQRLEEHLSTLINTHECRSVPIRDPITWPPV